MVVTNPQLLVGMTDSGNLEDVVKTRNLELLADSTLEGVANSQTLLDISDCEDLGCTSGEEGVESPMWTIPEPEAETLAPTCKQPPTPPTRPPTNVLGSGIHTEGDPSWDP